MESKLESAAFSKYTKEEIAQIADKARSIVDIKDRKHRFEIHKSCFIGRELCKWFLVNGVKISLHNYFTLHFILHVVRKKCRDTKNIG